MITPKDVVLICAKSLTAFVVVYLFIVLEFSM